MNKKNVLQQRVLLIAWSLYSKLFWQLLFPSGKSYLIINKLDGKRLEIPFEGNENELLKLQQQLPDSVPK